MTTSKLSGLEGMPIPLNLARQWIMNFKQTTSNDETSHYFGENIILRILAANRCVGIRAYVGLDDNDQLQLVLVGVDEDGNNLLPSNDLFNAEEENIIAAPSPKAFAHHTFRPL